jgi:hypothetical protein
VDRPLRAPRLLQELGPRRVVLAASFHRFKALNAAEETDFATLVELIGAGNEIPDRFYRPRFGDYDELLQQYGVLHLHLGSRTSDTLLFLMQFTDRVTFLETNTHERFRRGCQQFIQTHRLPPVAKPTVVVKKRRGFRPPKT